MSNISEIIIVAGKRAFIERVYRKYNVMLTRFIARQNINYEDVVDITQETYCRLSRMKNVEDIEYPQAFLVRTATNLMRDRARRRQRRGGQSHFSFDEAVHSSDSLFSANGNSMPERLLEARENLHLFDQALAELSPKCRHIFVLNRFEGLSYGEIAKRYGISVSAVNKHMMKALAHFSKRLEK